jgi:hypothetical protein
MRMSLRLLRWCCGDSLRRLFLRAFSRINTACDSDACEGFVSSLLPFAALYLAVPGEVLCEGSSGTIK